jgi:hypothetical protein
MLVLVVITLSSASGASAQRRPPPSPRLPERGDTLPTSPGRAARDSVRARRERPKPTLALLEGFGVNVVLQRVNWWVRGADWADISLKSWGDNLRLGWEWDEDAFPTNMFGHPYGGGMYFNAGRDNGLSFWAAAPLTAVGSITWEYFGENLRPSLNDLYTTTFGGIVFGEVGHRIGGLIRDDRGRGVPRFLREIAAAPFDPVGSINRILRGEFARVSADPDDRDRSALDVTLQAGARVAVDSGPARTRSASGTLLADIAYGDAFAGPYRQPFDVFRVRLQLSPARGGINIARLRGRLYGHELTDTAAASRHIFTVAQKSEYLAGPAYKFGGQSLEAGLVSDFRAAAHAHIQTEVYAEWLLLGGLDAPGAGVRTRAYDFGPGAGVNAAATLVVGGNPLLSARWRFAVLHTVSGSKANHLTNFASAEASVPIAGGFGVGAYAGWYRQRSVYENGAGALLSYPEFRAYLTWHGSRGAPPRQAAGGAAL